MRLALSTFAGAVVLVSANLAVVHFSILHALVYGPAGHLVRVN